MDHPLVSVIVPIYNRAHMVVDFYNNIKNQTYKNWEVIFIDDLSEDDTAKIITSLAYEDYRIVLCKNKYSKGPAGARNTGLDLARGKYIAYQDSDDEWMPFHLETMVKYLETYDFIDVMTADPLRKNKNTGEVYHRDQLILDSNYYTLLQKAWLIDKKYTFDIQLKNRAITTQTIVGKAAILKNNKWVESLKAAEDNLHNLQLCSSDIRVCHIPNFHVVYWAHGGNITNALKLQSREQQENVQMNFIKYWQTIIRDFELTREQLKYCKENLSQVYAWHVAYHILEQDHRFHDAYILYLKAFINTPYDIKIFAKLITLPIKAIRYSILRLLSLKSN